MPVTITLNDYQAANLRWLLQVAWNCPHDRLPHLGTGDWVGEIPQLLEQEMIERDVRNLPNVSDEWASKPLLGSCNGMKRADYENNKQRESLERIQSLAALKNTRAEDKLRLIAEAAKHWWGVEHIHAISRG